MTARQLDPATAAEACCLHPTVRRVLRTLTRDREILGQWDEITVDDRPFEGGRIGKDPRWVTILAKRHPGTLAETSIQVHVRTSGPLRAKFAGGYRYTIGSDQRIDTWRDLRIYR